jgi:penicillin-binding protein 1A
VCSEEESEGVGLNQAARSRQPAPGFSRFPRWLWGKRIWLAAAIAVVFAAATGYVVWALQDLPDPNQDVLAAGDVVVLDRHGKLIEDWNHEGHYHITLRLDQMGKYSPKATLAAEDRNFYNHGGVDAGSTLRALWVDVTSGGFNEGGSTITQQLVKIQLLTPQKSIERKVREMVLAVALEQHFSKDQILAMYMNRVYYGHGAYGIGAASKTYFSKDAKDLTPAQAAFLAGLIQAPTAYDPKIHYELAHERELYVLQGMVATNAITSSEADQASSEDVKAEFKFQPTARQSKAPHFVDYVLSKLESTFGAAAIQQGGIVVHTTLDLALQQTAEQAVQNGVKDLAWANVNNSALLAADPKTGEILAWVGSAGYGNDKIAGQFDVVLAPRQPGSSFKPYVYEAALRDHKITLATTLNDMPTDFNGYRPNDFDNRGMGKMTARRALVMSRNIPAVQVGQMEGMNNVIALAKQMGISAHLDPGLATAIGASEVPLLQHVQGYQVFAHEGQRVDLSVIKEIDDSSGKTIFNQDQGARSVLSPASNYLITDVLKNYQNQWNFGWNRQMASKTGTSDNGKGGIPDSWIMAYNPDIVIGVWVGNTAPNGGGGLIHAYGESVGTTVMARFVNNLPSTMQGWYKQPPGIVHGCGAQAQEIFLKGTEGCSGTPSPTTSPTASPSASPTASPSENPSPSPSPIPSPSEAPSPSAAPSPAPPSPAAPAPSPAPSP